MVGAIIFSLALAGFLLGCLIAALITDPGTQQGAIAAHHSCSGYGEHGASVALGGCATEIPTCCAPRGDWVAGDFKPHHGQEI